MREPPTVTHVLASWRHMTRWICLWLPFAPLVLLVVWYGLACAFPLSVFAAPLNHRPLVNDDLVAAGIDGLFFYLLGYLLVSLFFAQWPLGVRLAAALAGLALLLVLTAVFGLEGSGSSYFALRIKRTGIGSILTAPGTIATDLMQKSTKWVRRHHILAHVSDEDQGRRELVAESIYEMTRSDEADYVRFATEELQLAVIQALRFDDDGDRLLILEALSQWDSRSPKVHAAICEHFTSGNAEIRADAAILLYKLNATESATLAALRGLLNDSDAWVRKAAAAAILNSDPGNVALRRELSVHLAASAPDRISGGMRSEWESVVRTLEPSSGEPDTPLAEEVQPPVSADRDAAGRTVPDSIVVKVKGNDGEPLADVRYVLETPDGKRLEGKTDSSGRIEVHDTVRGVGRITFPDLEATQSVTLEK